MTVKKGKSHTGAKKTASETAYSFLASRMRTMEEVKTHLADKGFGADEIQDTINDLVGLRYIDDYLYAMRYFEYNREKKRGSLKASRELAEKGIDQETIRNAREDFFFENKVDEFEDALAIAVRELMLRDAGRLESSRAEGDSRRKETFGSFGDRLTGAIARKLENKGFARETIFRVIERIRNMDQAELS